MIKKYKVILDKYIRNFTEMSPTHTFAIVNTSVLDNKTCSWTNTSGGMRSALERERG